MFQEFNTDTLGARFIKSLLSQTPIPLFDSVVDGDQLVEGCYYVYKRFIIQCVKTGVLTISENENLYPSNNLYPSIYLFPVEYKDGELDGGYRLARFYVKSLVDVDTRKTHGTFFSSDSTYDSETHKYLGKYLRYVYTTSGLNLFPFYNSYAYQKFSDVELFKSNNTVNIKRVSKQQYQIIAVPILFGHTYTVALDCPTEVLMRACIHDNTGYVEESILSKEFSTSLSTSGAVYSRMQFKDPKKFRIETDLKSAIMLQHNLYLLIQVPLHNDSSIVVLENYDNKQGIHCDINGVRKIGLINPSLLYMNTHKTYAFSNRLLEYLLGNVIWSGDHVTGNITTIQNKLTQLFPDYKDAYIRGKIKSGIWDANIENLIFELVEDYSKSNVIYDQDGNINKDTQVIIYSKGVNY